MTSQSALKYLHSNRTFLWCCGLLVLLGFLAYCAALNGPLFFDDRPNLTANDFVQIDGTRFDDWRTAALSSSAGMTRRPVAMLTFAFNHALFGDLSPVHLKAINLFIHVVIGLLVYGLAGAILASPALKDLELGDRRLLALLAAAIWFLHPLHVSAVLYAIQRMAQLSTLFVVAGLLVFCRYRLRWAQRGAVVGEVIAAALWLVLLSLLAVFSKENGALLPWLIVAVEVTLFRGVWQQRPSPALVRAGWLVFAIPLLCLGLLLLAMPETIIGGYARREFSLEQRLFTQCRILWQYLSWLVLPDIRTMGFQHDDIALSRGLFLPFTTYLSLLAWLALLWGCWRFRTTFPLLIFAVSFYFIGHFMESTVYPLEMVYEHRNYLPSVGVMIFVAGLLGWLVNALPPLRFGFAALGIVLVLTVLLGVRTHAWSDELLRSRVNVANHPMSPRAHFFYGNALFQRYQQRLALGLSEEEERNLAVAARYHFEKMHEINGRSVAALVMLYQLESKFFPQMPDRLDRLEQLSLLLQSRRLQSSDYSALSALVKYYIRDPADPDRSRFTGMLDGLIDRYPRNAAILILKYQLLASVDEVSSKELLQLLEQAARINPQNLEIYPYQIIEYEKDANWAAIHEAILDWMREDRSRRQLPALRMVFGQQ